VEAVDEIRGRYEVHINREDVVQAALTVERWCAKHYDEEEGCDCPFFANELDECFVIEAVPKYWFYEDEENGEV